MQIATKINVAIAPTSAPNRGVSCTRTALDEAVLNNGAGKVLILNRKLWFEEPCKLYGVICEYILFIKKNKYRIHNELHTFIMYFESLFNFFRKNSEFS